MKSFIFLFILSLNLQAEPLDIQDTETPFPDATPKTTKEECTTVDLTSKTGPVRSQTGETCYAYSAMDLLAFGLPDQHYSALHLAGIYADWGYSTGIEGLEKVEGFNGGSVKKAIDYALN